MPNHVATSFRVSGDDAEVKRFIKAITLPKDKREDLPDGVAPLAFELLLPLPEELEGIRSPAIIVSEEEYQAELKRREEFLAGGGSKSCFNCPDLPMTAERSAALKQKYGADNWYDWMLNEYGTKWGMYDIRQVSKKRGLVELAYNTAWAPATKYFLTVSQDFPTLEFYHEFADEGGGFVGYELICNGEVIEQADYGWTSNKGIKIRQNVGYYYDDEEEEEAEEAEE